MRCLADWRPSSRVDDDCIVGDGSWLCETHKFRPMAYYLDQQGQLLIAGTFDPEETGWPVCEDSQKYDSDIAAAYRGGYHAG